LNAVFGNLGYHDHIPARRLRELWVLQFESNGRMRSGARRRS
jgi:hypothetical protein